MSLQRNESQPLCQDIKVSERGIKLMVLLDELRASQNDIQLVSKTLTQMVDYAHVYFKSEE